VERGGGGEKREEEGRERRDPREGIQEEEERKEEKEREEERRERPEGGVKVVVVVVVVVDYCGRGLRIQHTLGGQEDARFKPQSMDAIAEIGTALPGRSSIGLFFPLGKKRERIIVAVI
jgi:hypothetical protein